LLLIKTYFNEKGNIYTTNNKRTSLYQVRDINSIINIIIPHFNKYLLLTRKYNDFIIFSNVINLVNNKEHLSYKGLLKIVSLKSSLNKGLYENLKVSFTNVALAERYVANIFNKFNIS
jgi:LAGLIDADG endonuclease